MGLSRDQKRKAKLKKRAERSHKQESLAYNGTKYQSPQFTPITFRTERGIYEAYVLSKQTLTDHEVETTLGELVTLMRQGPLPQLSAPGSEGSAGEFEGRGGLIVLGIRRHWEALRESGELPGREDLIGILRTILRSLETRRSMSMHPQGYLRFLHGFMKDLGVRVELLGPVDPDDDELDKRES